MEPKTTTDPHYPHTSGDVLVLGPECFINADGRVISYQGENYYSREYISESRGEYTQQVARVAAGAALEAAADDVANLVRGYYLKTAERIRSQNKAPTKEVKSNDN